MKIKKKSPFLSILIFMVILTASAELFRQIQPLQMILLNIPCPREIASG